MQCHALERSFKRKTKPRNIMAEKQRVRWVTGVVAIFFYISTCKPFVVNDPASSSSVLVRSSGTATSGKEFLGDRIRKFPEDQVRFLTHKTYGAEKRFEKVEWAHERSCPKWSVTTTIFNVSDAMRIQTQLPEDWCMVIVGDKKGFQMYELNEGKSGRVIYLNPKDQEEIERMGANLSKLLPWNSFGRKNLGYLYAIASGARLIWDFDDDNALLSLPPRILESREVRTVLEVRQKPEMDFCASFNPMPLMGAKMLPSWPRGLPLSDIKNKACQAEAYFVHHVARDSKAIGVFQSLANHDPDVDAIYRLTQPLPFDFDPPYENQTVLIPTGAYSPFNAQATLFTYEAMFILILPITVHGRVADIWRSYFGQRLLRDIGFEVAFTYPQVVQDRNSHNYLADLDSEQPLYMKSGKMIKLLQEWSSRCQSMECHFEALIIELYERDYIDIGDVDLVQEWIESLHQVGYQFPPLLKAVRGGGEELQKREEEEERWPNLQLFIPVFPGGEEELGKSLLRSLEFFWPKSNLNLLFLVDEEIQEKESFSIRLIKKVSSFTNSTAVTFNSIREEIYGHGHDRQQLLMFWAENFTDAEYVGFLDDDTLFTNHVQLNDLFDNDMRPHVFGRSNFASDSWWKSVEQTTSWAYGGEKEVMRTMSHFPVIVKTSHLKDVREAILRHHPEYSCFDAFFSELKRREYSQFNMFHQYLWHNKREEYAWHLEATSDADDHFRLINGTTEAMRRPMPRCALHANYDGRTSKSSAENQMFFNGVMRRGFCYSLTKEEYDNDETNYTHGCINSGYTWQNMTAIPNVDQWLFEYLDWRWDPRFAEAHRERRALNKKNDDWNQEVLKQLFDEKHDAT